MNRKIRVAQNWNYTRQQKCYKFRKRYEQENTCRSELELHSPVEMLKFGKRYEQKNTCQISKDQKNYQKYQEDGQKGRKIADCLMSSIKNVFQLYS